MASQSYLQDLIGRLERDLEDIKATLVFCKELATGSAVEAEASEIKPPGKGTISSKVWGICEDIKRKQKGRMPSLDQVLSRAIHEGINAGTATTQYRRWRKFESDLPF